LTLVALLIAAVLLSFERIGYVWAWRRPEDFARRCRAWGLGTDPVIALERLFYVFKVIQVGVIVGWIVLHQGDAFPSLSPEPWAFWTGLALALVGQTLNFGTFHAIGRTGVFYGVRFGRDVPWCHRFPFNIVDHPQYVGTVMTIWGALLGVQFPAPDWWLLPALLTFSYALGALLENHADVEAPAGAKLAVVSSEDGRNEEDEDESVVIQPRTATASSRARGRSVGSSRA